MFMSSSRNKFTLLYQNSVTDVFVGFRPPCWCPSRWAPAWRLHTNLYKFEQNISSDISYTEYSSGLNLGEGLCLFTSFYFPDSWLYLLNGFDFCFDLFWMAWHWKPAIRKRLFEQVWRDIWYVQVVWQVLFAPRRSFEAFFSFLEFCRWCEGEKCQEYGLWRHLDSLHIDSNHL